MSAPEKEKLYRLPDVLDEIKQIDELLSKHKSSKGNSSSLPVDQYKARKEQLLTYFINEINASVEYKGLRLEMIKLVMERFYSEIKEDKSKLHIQDKNLNSLVEAISA